ncbi:hypothetical protein D3C71_2172880 [compost metagenome]
MIPPTSRTAVAVVSKVAGAVNIAIRYEPEATFLTVAPVKAGLVLLQVPEDAAAAESQILAQPYSPVVEV